MCLTLLFSCLNYVSERSNLENNNDNSLDKYTSALLSLESIPVLKIDLWCSELFSNLRFISGGVSISQRRGNAVLQNVMSSLQQILQNLNELYSALIDTWKVNLPFESDMTCAALLGATFGVQNKHLPTFKLYQHDKEIANSYSLIMLDVQSRVFPEQLSPLIVLDFGKESSVNFKNNEIKIRNVPYLWSDAVHCMIDVERIGRKYKLEADLKVMKINPRKNILTNLLQDFKKSSTEPIVFSSLTERLKDIIDEIISPDMLHDTAEKFKITCNLIGIMVASERESATVHVLKPLLNNNGLALMITDDTTDAKFIINVIETGWKSSVTSTTPPPVVGELLTGQEVFSSNDIIVSNILIGYAHPPSPFDYMTKEIIMSKIPDGPTLGTIWAQHELPYFNIKSELKEILFQGVNLYRFLNKLHNILSLIGNFVIRSHRDSDALLDGMLYHDRRMKFFHSSPTDQIAENTLVVDLKRDGVVKKVLPVSIHLTTGPDVSFEYKPVDCSLNHVVLNINHKVGPLPNFQRSSWAFFNNFRRNVPNPAMVSLDLCPNT